MIVGRIIRFKMRRKQNNNTGSEIGNSCRRFAGPIHLSNSDSASEARTAYTVLAGILPVIIPFSDNLNASSSTTPTVAPRASSTTQTSAPVWFLPLSRRRRIRNARCSARVARLGDWPTDDDVFGGGDAELQGGLLEFGFADVA